MSVFDTDNQSFDSSPELSIVLRTVYIQTVGFGFWFLFFSVVVIPLLFVCKRSVW